MKPILAITDEQLADAVASMNLLGVEPAFGFGKTAVTTERYRWSDDRPDDPCDSLTEFSAMLTDQGRRVDVSAIKRDLRHSNLPHRKVMALRVNHPMASYLSQDQHDVFGDLRNRNPRSTQSPCLSFPAIVGFRREVPLSKDMSLSDVIVLDGWSRISAMQNFIQDHAISRYRLAVESSELSPSEEAAAQDLYFSFLGDFYVPAIALTLNEWRGYVYGQGAA